MKLSIKEQERRIREAARRRHLKIVADRRLSNTPYAAMNPHAARALKQPCKPRSLCYDPTCKRKHSPISTREWRCIDLRHEIKEYDKMGKRKPTYGNYWYAHKYANRTQRDPNIK